jgi:hypothetical protein
LLLDHVHFAEGVGGLGLEQQEPGADRAVTVLEAGGTKRFSIMVSSAPASAAIA